MRIDWSPLQAELAQWRADGLELPFWWRDDDAIAPTAALDTLTSLSEETGVPVHLAIIPKDATDALAKDIAECFVPVVHGWAHLSHTPDGVKNAEFGTGRPASDALDDAAKGIARLQFLFGDRLAPMFVPPWNRISPEVVAGLAEVGFNAVSTYNPRKSALAAPGVAQINTHIDPIFWRGHRGLVDAETLVSQIVTLLQDRRAGLTDTQEPLGYLTHHLVHDADIWEFSRQFLLEICGGPVRLYRHDGKGIS
ncbi:polysaccharide deacetylase family protein [uncultured Shimia sp.]|mgnify:CR=1 FL=1|uniref:polysaccharide deacetylase family protein n=1 Tax=uncultured Shimia sp. TaxID=573152 RepID=UPI0025F273A0|nr:polysaccharide deacetylase family protein [uncultured Shimia sp.]